MIVTEAMAHVFARTYFPCGSLYDLSKVQEAMNAALAHAEQCGYCRQIHNGTCPPGISQPGRSIEADAMRVKLQEFRDGHHDREWMDGVQNALHMCLSRLDRIK